MSSFNQLHKVNKAGDVPFFNTFTEHEKYVSSSSSRPTVTRDYIWQQEEAVMKFEASWGFVGWRWLTGFFGNFIPWFLALFILTDNTFPNSDPLLVFLWKGVAVAYVIYLLPVHLFYTDVRSENESLVRFSYTIFQAWRMWGYQFWRYEYRCYVWYACWALGSDLSSTYAALCVACGFMVYVNGGSRDLIGEVNLWKTGFYSTTIVGLAILLWQFNEARIGFTKNFNDNEQNIAYAKRSASIEEVEDQVERLKKMEKEADIRWNMAILFFIFYVNIFGPYLRGGLPMILYVLSVNPISGHTGDIAFVMIWNAVAFGIIHIVQSTIFLLYFLQKDMAYKGKQTIEFE